MPIIHYTDNNGKRVVGDAVLIKNHPNLEKELEALFPGKIITCRVSDRGSGAVVSFKEKHQFTSYRIDALVGDFVVAGEDGEPHLVAPWSVLQSSDDLYASLSDSNKKSIVKDAFDGKSPEGPFETQSLVSKVDAESFTIPRFFPDGFSDVLAQLKDFFSGEGMKPIISFKAHYFPLETLTSITVHYHRFHGGKPVDLFPGDTVIGCDGAYLVQRYIPE